MTDEHTPSGSNPQRVVDALADLFDDVAPNDRAGAEQELREAGLDPAAIGARVRELAARPLAAATRSGQAETVRPTALQRAGARRHARAERPPSGGPVARRARRALFAGTLLTLGVAIGLAIWRGGEAAAPTRLSEVTPRPAPNLPRQRAGEPPADGPAIPVAVGAGRTALPANPTPPPHSAQQQPPEATPRGWIPPAADLGATGRPPSDAARAALAQDAEWILDSSNWQQAEGLLPPVVLERVKRGDYWYSVAPADPERFKARYSARFWEASAANAGRYDVDAETCGLKEIATGQMPSFYFGYPFPTIDRNDPLAACKAGWNFEAANSMGEGQGGTFTLNGISSEGEFRRVKLSLQTLSYLGRHGGPIYNPTKLRASLLSNLLEPQDVDGIGGLTARPNDWHEQDKIWSYVPATRRVRRVNAATRSDPLAGLDIFSDDLNCLGGKTEYFNWKIVGEQVVLAPLIGPASFAQRTTASPTRFEVELPYPRAAYESPGAKGIGWLVVENLVLVPRPVWVIEVESPDPYYAFGKVILYMDKEMYRIYWKLVHNRAGEYFYNAMCAYHYSKSADDTFSAVTPSLVVGVNDRMNRACLAGRASTQFIERAYREDHFTMRSLTTMSD